MLCCLFPIDPAFPIAKAVGVAVLRALGTSVCARSRGDRRAQGRCLCTNPEKAQVVKRRYFAGRSLEETAQALGIARATVQRHWVWARAWLYGQLHPS
jgi:hypothetical protein